MPQAARTGHRASGRARELVATAAHAKPPVQVAGGDVPSVRDDRAQRTDKAARDQPATARENRHITSTATSDQNAAERWEGVGWVPGRDGPGWLGPFPYFVLEQARCQELGDAEQRDARAQMTAPYSRVSRARRVGGGTRALDRVTELGHQVLDLVAASRTVAMTGGSPSLARSRRMSA